MSGVGRAPNTAFGEGKPGKETPVILIYYPWISPAMKSDLTGGVFHFAQTWICNVPLRLPVLLAKEAFATGCKGTHMAQQRSLIGR